MRAARPHFLALTTTCMRLLPTALCTAVAHDFPGRVVNAAGQYVAGAEKEQLILATGGQQASCWRCG